MKKYIEFKSLDYVRAIQADINNGRHINKNICQIIERTDLNDLRQVKRLCRVLRIRQPIPGVGYSPAKPEPSLADVDALVFERVVQSMGGWDKWLESRLGKAGEY